MGILHNSAGFSVQGLIRLRISLSGKSTRCFQAPLHCEKIHFLAAVWLRSWYSFYLLIRICFQLVEVILGHPLSFLLYFESPWFLLSLISRHSLKRITWLGQVHLHLRQGNYKVCSHRGWIILGTILEFCLPQILINEVFRVFVPICG